VVQAKVHCILALIFFAPDKSSSALLEQWRLEIEKHTGGKMKAYIYHGPGKKISKKVGFITSQTSVL